MENKVFYTEKALAIIILAGNEALAGDRVMTYYQLGRLNSFLFLLEYPDEFNHVFNNILTLLAENEK